MEFFTLAQITDLRGYVNNEVLSDVQFIVEGIPVHAHKVINNKISFTNYFIFVHLRRKWIHYYFVVVSICFFCFVLILYPRITLQILCLRCPFFRNLLTGEYMESRYALLYESDVIYFSFFFLPYKHFFCVFFCVFFVCFFFCVFLERAREVTINDVSYGTFLLLLQYVYCDQVDIAVETAMDLFQVRT